MKPLRMISLLAVISSLVIACGGGGGEKGQGLDAGEEAGISYSGITAQAVITSSNAEEISMTAFEGSETAIGDRNTVQKSSSGLQAQAQKDIDPSRPRALIISQTLERSFQDADILPKSGAAASGAMEHDSITINGDCGGSMEQSINYDPETGEINGTTNFSAYCSNGVTVTGNTNMSGRYDINDPAGYQVVTVNFNDLNTSYEGETSVSRGSITYDYTASPDAAEMNMLISCSCSGKVYNYENFGMTFSAGEDSTGQYLEFTLSGRFYDPAYGYVDASTVRPFRIYAGAGWPFTGLLVVSGSGNSKAKLEMVSRASYRIYSDEDGDGSFDTVRD
ncbi:MAG: hypothetical protein HZA16_10415 [Nitrospirae bacterium]|nr:hypothetical protein [Nitrospirota bacterium]